ncbi:MAG: hypoxanthine phosphoribosyltransferase [Planctomycetaceae bacterium]
MPLEPALSAERIADAVARLAERISADYAGKELLVVGVLKGGWMFMADLVRRLTLPVRCEFVRVSSYGDATQSSGEPQLLFDVETPLAGRHVLLVDDIVDTGLSIAWLKERLSRREPASLAFCVLLDKPARRRVELRPEYVGVEIPDRFVVGYGMDHAERYRELPYVAYLIEDSEPTGVRDHL